MTSQLMAAVFAVGIVVLFLLDREPRSRMSLALWIPMTWLAIGGSRVVSAWLDPNAQVSAASAYLEGNPLDRNVQATLLSLGVIVLLGRAGRVGEVLKANIPVVLFFLYCGASTLWSEFPDTTFRRWIKAIGDLVMVLVVLTDADRSAALKLPARVGFLLIPLSILLLKYFPDLARDFNDITGEPEYTGVATSKNGLGTLCMLFGLGSVWRFLDAYRSGEGRRRIGRLVAHGAIVLMVLWLFRWANSMTALICFTIGTGLLLLTASSTVARRPVVVHAFVWLLLMGSLSVVVLGMNEAFVQALGRDATLTGRTAIWNRVLAMVEHPWFGTGFESFWLGERLERMLGIYRGINQAHNGYIEVFLNLGWVGIGFLALVLVTGYRNVAIALRRDRAAGRVRLAYFTIGVLINLSEASFKMMSPVWIFFLLAIMSVPEASIRKVVRRSEVRGLGATARSPTGGAGSDGRIAGMTRIRAPR